LRSVNVAGRHHNCVSSALVDRSRGFLRFATGLADFDACRYRRRNPSVAARHIRYRTSQAPNPRNSQITQWGPS
jgi:hypothetical protein